MGLRFFVESLLCLTSKSLYSGLLLLLDVLAPFDWFAPLHQSLLSVTCSSLFQLVFCCCFWLF